MAAEATAPDARREVDSLGLTLRYHVWEPLDAGPGTPTVLALHGFLDQGLSFRWVAGALRRRYRLLALDQRGHGTSDWVGGGGYYHFPDYVRDVYAVLAAEGLERVALVGHSMGASVATYFTGACPERVWGLALLDGVGPPHVPAARGPQALRRWLDDVAGVVARSPGWPERPARRPDTLDAMAARLVRASPFAAEAVRRQLAWDASEPAGQDGEGRPLRVWRHDPLHRTRGALPFDAARFEAFMGLVACPSLLLWGAKTPFRPAAADARAAHLPTLQVTVLEGAGHNLHHERPGAVADALVPFLADAWDAHVAATTPAGAP